MKALLLLLFTSACLVAADIEVQTSGGGSASSGHYKLTDSIGQVFVGTAESSSYSVSDGFWHEVAAPVTPVSIAPVTVTNGPGGILLTTLLSAFQNPEGDPLFLYALDATTQQGGTLINSNGWVLYTPPAGYHDVDSFKITVRDANGNLAIATMSLQSVSQPFSIVPVPNQIAYVLKPLTLTVQTTNSAKPLMFGLAGTVPSGAAINATNGLFSWTPTRDQARSTNWISVVVTNGVSPITTATNTFKVLVDDYVEFGLGRMVVMAGQTNSVGVSLATSAALTNIHVLFQAPKDRFPTASISNSAPGKVNASLQYLDQDTWLLDFTAAAGQLLGTGELGRLSFAASPTNRTTLVPLLINSVINMQSNGQSVWYQLTNNGRAVVINEQPLLEALPKTNNLPNLALYGKPGIGYDVYYATDAINSNWSSVWHGIMPADGMAPITGLTNTGSHQFFSAREQASLTLTRVGNTLILNFFGTLQESDSVKGPYKDMTVTSPYTAAIGTANKFYRSRSN